MTGKIISNYRILEQLGGGMMGVVYRAQDMKLKRFVALKFLHPYLSSETEGKRRFMREARAASALDHNNICTIYEIDEAEDGQMFIAMAYYDGETLKKKIARGLLSFQEARNIVIHVARGLASAHDKGIIHRDIKPANIMITKQGEVKIVDFGLAKLVGESRLTEPNRTVGTIAYMSPEQAHGAEVDHRTDIWSLGVVLYEMLTGRMPFLGEDAGVVCYAILNDAPEPITKHIPKIPSDLEMILSKTLVKNPSNRFQNANKLLASLGETTRPPFRWRNVIRRPVLLFSVVALFLFILATIFFREIHTNSMDALNDYVEGKNAYQAQDYDRAIEALNKAVSTDSTFALAYELLSRIYYRKNFHDLAETMINKAIKFSQELSPNMQLRMKYHKARIEGEWDLAFYCIEKLIALEPNVADWYYELGWLYAMINASFKQSVAAYQKAIERNQTPCYYTYLGEVYLKWGKREEAISALKKYVELKPDKANSHDKLGEAYLLTGYYDKAKQQFDKSLELSPDFFETIRNLGDFHLVRGENQAALEQYERLRKSLERSWIVTGYYKFARYYLNYGKLDEAKDQIDKVLASETSYWPVSRLQAFWVLGLLHLKKGATDSVEMILQKMEDISSVAKVKYHEEYLHHLKSMLHLKRNSFDLAIEELKKAIEMGPWEYAFIRDALAETYFRKGDFRSALQEYYKVFELNPNYPYSHYKLGQVYEKQGEESKAIHEYETFLKIWENADPGIALVARAKERLAKLQDQTIAK